MRITEIRSRHSRHTTPRLVTVRSSIIRSAVVRSSVWSTITRMPVTIVVAIASRMRISLVIVQRIPAHVITKRDVEDKRDQRRAPPTSLFVKLAARAPRPVIVVVNPTTVVIRRPAPRLVTNPRPTVRRTPGPITVAIWRPVAVDADGARMWPPDPAVIICVSPLAIVL